MASEPSKSFTSHKPAPNLLRDSHTRHGRRRIIGLVMDFLSRKTLNSFLLLGGFIVLGAVLLLSEDMLRLGSTGIFSLKYPDHQFTRGVRELAAKIVAAG